jgi:arabinogalactan oligomer / maltooligosaccharide transport system substrate-binding protein
MSVTPGTAAPMSVSQTTPPAGDAPPPATGLRGPQRHRRNTRAALVVVVVVIVIVAGAVGYLYYAKKLPGQSSKSGCSKSTSITVWQDFSPTEFPAFSKAVTQFESENPGVSITWVNQTSPSPSNYATAALACAAPDILIGSSDFAGGLFYDGFLANLTSLLPSSAFSDFLPVALADNTQSGQVFGFPLNVNGVAMIYNKQLIPEAPTTTTQMLDEAKNATTYSGGTIETAGLVYALGSDGGYRIPAWAAGFGGVLFNPNGTPAMGSPAWANAWSFTNNFSSPDDVQPSGITSSATWESLFEEGKAGIIFDGPWDIETYIAALGSANVGVAPMPMISQTGLWPQPLWGSIGAYVSLPLASGAKPALFNESVKFAQFLASPLVEGELWNSSGDIPSLSSTFSYVQSLHIPFVNGFLDQFYNHSQAFPNTVQMTYYWTPFTDECTAYLAGSVSALAGVEAVQAAVVASMQQNHIAPY